MRTEEIEFTSDGLKLSGRLTIPDGMGPFPAIAIGGGWLYVKEINLPLYAERAAERGIASLAFDYRNFGASEGVPRQHVNPWEQIEDIRCAISYLETDSRFDRDRLGVWGVSYGGGHALIVGGIDSRVRCVVSTVPVIDGFENERRINGTLRFRELQAAILEERRNRFLTGKHGYHTAYGTNAGVVTVPTDEMLETYEHLKATVAPRYEMRSTFGSDEWLLNYSVYPYIRRLLETPTLMAITERDDYTFVDLQTQAFNDIPTVKKKLVNLPNIARVELYRDRSPAEVMAKHGVDWLVEHLLDGPA